MTDPQRISVEEYRDDPGKWLKHSRDQQVIVESESGRVWMVIGTTGENLFPDPPEEDWDDYEVPDEGSGEGEDL